MRKITLILCTLILSLGLSNCKTTDPIVADTIYYNGDILTMDGDSPQYVEAIAVKDGRILFVGSKSEAEKLQGNKTAMYDLEGKTMLPGFIDPHSHFMSSLTMNSQANCQPSPAGNGNSVAGVIDALVKLKSDKKIPDGETIIGYGYDDSAMPNGTLLNRDDLDKALPNNPVIVTHVSMHGAVLNSKAMEMFNINSDTETVEGGVVVRKPGTNEPYGLIMEMNYLPIFAGMPKASVEQQLEQLKDGQMLYAAAGVTTAQEGATHMPEVNILKHGAKENKLFIDIVSYPLFTEMDTLLKTYRPSEFGRYDNHLKLGGIKITADGSPQGRTAFFTTPYLADGPSGQKNWKGQPSFDQETTNALVKRIYDEGLQCMFHANGDATIDMLIKAHQYASGGDDTKDRRTIAIHAQFARKDQLGKFLEYKIIPSFYTEHTYFFADTHIKLRGMEQASSISPMRSAIELGIRPTNHTDFNVVPIDQMFVIWSAVNRISRNDVTIGENEKISPYQALQAITSNVAYQYFEENNKGKLKENLLADLVILDKNPIKVDPIKIKDIKVLETFKEGKSIYSSK